MKKRRAYVSFPTEYGNTPQTLAHQKRIDGVNIRFTTKVYSDAGNPASASFTIYNLNREDLQFLSTSAATWLQKQNLIQLYAGYDDEVELLASGQITEAIPEGNPDVGLSVRLISGLQWYGQNIELQKNNITIRELLKDCARTMGFTYNEPAYLESNEWLNKVVPNFSFTGTPYQELSTIQAMCGGFNSDGDGLNIVSGVGEITVWSPNPQANASVLLVSKETGMVGYPQPTAAGVQVKILLNPTVRPGDVIEVQSVRTPFINGQYYITSIQHEGELRGNNWYSTLTCSRMSGYKYGVENEQ